MEMKKLMKILGRSLHEYRLNEDHVYMCRDVGRDLSQSICFPERTTSQSFPDWSQADWMRCGGDTTIPRENEDTGRHEGYYQLYLLPTTAEVMSDTQPTRTYLMKL